MRFRICSPGWPLQGGAAFVPPGSVIDDNSNDTWSLLARDLPPPMNATPLDDEAYYAQRKTYPDHHRYLRPAVPPSKQTTGT
jgi:hypothetical protein